MKAKGYFDKKYSIIYIYMYYLKLDQLLNSTFNYLRAKDVIFLLIHNQH